MHPRTEYFPVLPDPKGTIFWCVSIGRKEKERNRENEKKEPESLVRLQPDLHW